MGHRDSTTAALTVAPTVAPTVARTAAQARWSTVSAAPRAAITARPTVALTVARTVARTVVPTVARTVAQAAEVSGALATRGGPVDDRPALRRCTAVAPDTFAEQVWGRTASLSRSADLPSGFDDLFSLDVVDDLVSHHGLRTPFLRVARDGRTTSPAAFTRGGGVGAGVGDQVADDQLARLFADGSTLVLQGLHRTHAPIAALCRQLSADLGHPAQVNAYVTPPQSQGFDDHYDVHDVFVLQVAGRKRWTIHAPVHRDPLRDEVWTDRRAQVGRAAREPALLEVTLEPGDALYLPRGFLHAARALGGTSAHLTVGIHAWTRTHLLEQVLARLGDVEGLRASLPMGTDVTDPAALAGEIKETLRLVQENLDLVSAEDVATGLRPAADTAVRAEPVPPMAQARAVETCDEASTVRWRHGQRTVLEQAGDEVVVRTVETSTRLPGVAVPALDRLTDGAVLGAADVALLCGSGTAEAVELLRTLLRRALVVRA